VEGEFRSISMPSWQTWRWKKAKKKVNDFIRAGGLFDAVADFDAATLDPATGAMKASMQPNQTTGGPGELLHPNRVGYQAMAETIDLKLLAPSPGQ